jgi:cytochrome c peroxidase
MMIEISPSASVSVFRPAISTTNHRIAGQLVRFATSFCVFVLLFLTAQTGCDSPRVVNEEFEQTRADETWRAGRIVLGSPSLTAGISGEAKVRIEDIAAWLDDPRNHQPLDFALPLGLHEAVDDVHVPEDNPLSRAKIELGRQLFFDDRLPKYANFTCADCHHPQQSFSRAMVTREDRNSQMILNRILSVEQFWDGKSPSLEAQVEVPISHIEEMGTSPEDCVRRIGEIAGYRLQFERIFGEVSFANLSKALASFERALVTTPAPYDYHVVLERFDGRDPATLDAAEQQLFEQAQAGVAADPMSEDALKGRDLFFSDRTGCAACHWGPNFTDEDYHNVGVGMNDDEPDLGRFKITGKEEDRGAFKTPTLRNLEYTSPYMHDGRFHNARTVVTYFVDGCHPNDHLDPMITRLDLTETEIRQLVAFLASLSSPLPQVRTDGLPE